MEATDAVHEFRKNGLTLEISSPKSSVILGFWKPLIKKPLLFFYPEKTLAFFKNPCFFSKTLFSLSKPSENAFFFGASRLMIFFVFRFKKKMFRKNRESRFQKIVSRDFDKGYDDHEFFQKAYMHFTSVTRNIRFGFSMALSSTGIEWALMETEIRNSLIPK